MTHKKRRSGAEVDPVMESLSPTDMRQMILELRRVQAELRENEQNYKTLIDSGRAMIWLSGPDKLCTYFNQVWLEFTGRRLEQEIGNGWAEGVHPDDFQRCLDIYVGAFDRREKFSMEYRLRRHDGAYRWILDDGCPRYDSKGEFIGYVGHCLDIHEHKQASMQILHNETRLRGLVRILQFRAKSTQEFLDYALNEAISLTESKLGYIYFYHEDRKEFVLNTWSKGVMAECEVVNPKTCYALEATGIWGEVVRQRTPIVVNDFIASNPLKKGFPAGHVMLTRFMTVPVFKDDQIVIVAGVANKEADYEEADVLQLTLLMDAVWKSVEAKRGEEELRETRAILQTALDQSQAGIAIADAPSGLLRYVNNAGLGISGGDRQDLVEGVGVNQYVASWHLMDFDGTPLKPDEVPLARPVMFGETCSREFIIRRNPDDERIVLANAAPIKDPDGKVIAGIVVFMDITDRKQAACEKEKLEAQLRQAQKMESVGRLAGGVAHDFNNMLGVILGHAELALEQVTQNTTLSADLVEIRKAAERSANLTRQLLAFARKQAIAPQVLDLNVTVEGMLKMLKRLIGEAIQLNWQPKLHLWPVLVDPTQIDQILANLCVNGRDAIGGIGTMALETENCVLDKSFCAHHPGAYPGEYAVLSVSDDGCGMDQKTLANLFEPFFTTKGLGAGTGLGLATVYGIVKQNGGFIDVASEPGQGTTFKIFLPRYKGKAAPVQEKEVPAVVSRGHETVLLVEDEPSILALARRMIEQQGYKVIAAGGPGEAIRLAMTHQGEIQLLITDVVMPEMNGRELAEKIRALYPRIKRVFMSGYTADVIAHHGVLEEGMSFIQKPFSKKELADTIRSALDALPAS